MGEIIYADFGCQDGLSYITRDADGKTTLQGCSIHEGSAVMQKKDGGFFVESGEPVSREDMARFLWLAAYLLDSEQRYTPDKMVCLDYDETVS